MNGLCKCYTATQLLYSISPLPSLMNQCKLYTRALICGVCVCCPGVRSTLALSFGAAVRAISWGFGGTAECVLASAQLGSTAFMHSDSEAHETQDSCALFACQDRTYPASPSRCQGRQTSFDSLTFKFYTPSPSSASLSLAPSSLSLSLFPSLSLISRPFCLPWRAIPELSIIAFRYFAVDGIGFDATTHSLRDLPCTPIRSACRAVVGWSSTLQHGASNLIHNLSSPLFLHLFFSVFYLPFNFLPFFICHCLSHINSIYFSLAYLLSLYTFPLFPLCSKTDFTSFDFVFMLCCLS